jgi:hypothetical protein
VLIIDTGPLVALVDRDQAACPELLETDPDLLVTTALVFAEADYLLNACSGRPPNMP